MFNLEKPCRKFILPSILNEVSGITFVANGSLAAVQDEQGVIYFIDPQNGQLMDQVAFGKAGDYEGLALNESFYFVLESNGTLSVVDRLVGATKRFKFKGSKGFDFEGLCLSPSGDRLWVGCKTHKKKKMNSSILVYGFDLRTMTYEPDPILEVRKPKEFGDFRISELCFRTPHELYILSGNPAGLAIYALETNQCTFQELNPTLLKQPEGMSFDEMGQLWISNEKKGAKANLMCFEKLK